MCMRPAGWNHLELQTFALKVEGISSPTLLLSGVCGRIASAVLDSRSKVGAVSQFIAPEGSSKGAKRAKSNPMSF